jgi:predicted GNAT family acetyltransferase
MQLVRFADIDEFAARVEPYLLAHEATHCLMLGLLSTLPRGPMPADEIPYMALVENAGAVVLVAMRTPPYNVILSLIAPDHAAEPSVALRLIASDLWSRYGDSLSGVHASAPLSRLFAERWQQQTGMAARLMMQERIYELETVIPVSGVPGSYRRTTEADRDLLVRWLEAFAAEALGPREHLDAADWVDRYFASSSRGGYLWEDGGVAVSFAAYGNPTAHGIRIGPVYTPPEYRGHGYASACVATLSPHLVENGRTFCYLFTDLANPTSNHIYRTVGYNPVSDVDVYEFEME